MNNYNGFSIYGIFNVKIEKEDEFVNSLDKIMTRERAIRFIKYLTSGTVDKAINVIASAKVGIPMTVTYNPYSFEIINFS